MTAEDSSIEALGALADPVRRALYRHVAAAPQEVGRDAAAEAAGVSRSLAAFHLDKLVDAGLLTASYRRPAGRGGPGAGRPAKLYRRADAEIAVALPPRSYGAAGRLLAEVVERAGLDRELQAAARAAGAAEQPPADLPEALRERGYAPFPDGEVLRLGNCPFHALADEFPALVCGMNLALLEGLAGDDWTPAMDPCAGGCCVSFSRRPGGESKNNNH
ncbi:helix-turn-helix domain-containing protein [Kitasatospora sp. NA04385]|uniref:helix-turn-helix transcriptional regulator n=1 Tax=Kitasatospora sp. NA04385 TaxID=2742135 RepID=UPI00158FA99C|nr:helix-turn-helix domain-containing protein [Kitasatospora sp. NA04385]QKW18323.1 helix-turn-helix domain-containing protein [Kitasatospora sp. NA04385]